MTAVKFSARLDLDQIFLFLDKHYFWPKPVVGVYFNSSSRATSSLS